MPPRATRKSTAKASASATKKSTTGSNTTSDTAAAVAPIRNTGNPKIFILPAPSNSTSPSPSSANSQSTILTLPHPSTGIPTRFLHHPSRGIFEIKKIASPSTIPQSWLVTPLAVDPKEEEDSPSSEPQFQSKESTQPTSLSPLKITNNKPPPSSTSTSTTWVKTGQTISDPTLYICTPLDPLFLLLPPLLPQNRFLLLEDITESLSEANPLSKHWTQILSSQITSDLISSRIKSISDTADAAGSPSYRINKTKVLRILAGKCEKMAKAGVFPRSMEEEFVKKALAKPVVEFRGVPAAEKAEEKEEEGEEKLKEGEKKKEDERKENIDPAATAPPPAETSPTLNIPPEMARLLKLRLSAQILSGYLTPALSRELSAHLESVHDFKPLDEYILELNKLKQDITLARAGDYSMKRSAEDEDESHDRRKKRRMEEEEEKKRKKNTSGGIKALAKVNTKGMAKMTSFFQKK
ncbi:ribonuclease H2, subunit B [Peziza echinospora]|nr:ribonuclease H2, subunit B [Peziza echinospora]